MTYWWTSRRRERRYGIMSVMTDAHHAARRRVAKRPLRHLGSLEDNAEEANTSFGELGRCEIRHAGPCLHLVRDLSEGRAFATSIHRELHPALRPAVAGPCLDGAIATIPSRKKRSLLVINHKSFGMNACTLNPVRLPPMQF
jgi:hypothetical protein